MTDCGRAGGKTVQKQILSEDDRKKSKGNDRSHEASKPPDTLTDALRGKLSEADVGAEKERAHLWLQVSPSFAAAF